MTSPTNLKIAQLRKKSRPAKVKAGSAPFQISLKGIQKVNGEMRQLMEKSARAPGPRKRRNAPIVHIEA